MTQSAPEVMPDFAAMRNQAAQNFLNQHGWGDIPLTLLFGEGSMRKYYRLQKEGKTIVWLDSPNPDAPQERLRNVVSYAIKLNEIGLRAPVVHEVDYQNGFALIEDFGDNVYSNLFDKSVNKEPYLSKALDCLIHLHRNLNANDMADLGNDLDYFYWENPYFTDWYWPARYNHETPPDISAEYHAIWKKLLTELPPLPKTMCMTDYHAPNLMALDDGKDIRSVGIIDFQDSILASPVYDVMSLLEDDRRDLDDAIGLKLRQRYRETMRETIDPELFDLHYAVLSAQRHAKNMGNFVRIATQKNAPRWVGYLPVTTKWFDRALHSHDYLAPLQKWFAKHYPDYTQPLENIRYFIK